jgi:hypothetical protein
MVKLIETKKNLNKLMSHEWWREMGSNFK